MIHHQPTPSGNRDVDMLLADYAAGTLVFPLHVLVGAHLQMKPAAAAFVDRLELLKGREIEDASAVAFACRDRMLASIFASEDADIPSSATEAQPAPADPVFPPSLQRYFGMSSQDVPWRSVLPGVKEWTVSQRDGVEAKLYWVKAGRKLPAHTHEGQEVTLLLKGGFTDQAGHYRRGDIAVADGDLDHTPVADLDEDCICFAVTDAPLKLTGPIATFFRSLFRH